MNYIAEKNDDGTFSIYFPVVGVDLMTGDDFVGKGEVENISIEDLQTEIDELSANMANKQAKMDAIAACHSGESAQAQYSGILEKLKPII